MASNTSSDVQRDSTWNRYNLPVYGKEQGLFKAIHGSALACIAVSMICACVVLTLSFRRQSFRSFFSKWTKCDRFIVYLSTCDLLFNISHSMDHLHMLVTDDHVRPLQLCETYAFFVFTFVSAQAIMTVLIAINAFVLIRFRKKFDFGKRDWKLLLITFGGSFLLCLLAAGLQEMGPTGFFCGVQGRLANIFFTTVPQCSVIIINSFLYALTWYHIRKETNRIQTTIGEGGHAKRASIKAGKTMTLFVAVFLIQYWASATWGLWGAITTAPIEIFFFVVTFSNLGGVLNCIVYFIMRKGSQTKSDARLSDNAAQTISEGIN